MTLKAFKAAIKPGLQVRVVEHWIERYHNTVRTVTAVQGNGYWFTQPGEPKRCWGPFPKASQLQFDGTIAKIIVDDERHWTLQLPAN